MSNFRKNLEIPVTELSGNENDNDEWMEPLIGPLREALRSAKEQAIRERDFSSRSLNSLYGLYRSSYRPSPLPVFDRRNLLIQLNMSVALGDNFLYR